MNVTIIVMSALISTIVSMFFYPIALRFAKIYGIVDNPDMRKLQRMPVPLMGGLVVYLGILTGGLILLAFVMDRMALWGLVSMAIMLCIGSWDDKKPLSVSFRFLVETVLVIIFILQTDLFIDNFYGMWGVYEMPLWVAYPFSVLWGVGIINAVNLIDGVDGYSSGYGILACIVFAVLFYVVCSQVMMGLALIAAGALLPFFLHNVFGIHSKMYMGDGDSLMLGMLMVLFTFYTVSSKGLCVYIVEYGGNVLVAGLAVLSIPVFDTLRVMVMRMCRRKSPFKPDKTHLHHLFIEMGFSHLGTVATILSLNLIMVLVWLVTWLLGGSMETQLYLILLTCLMVTFGFYPMMKIQQHGGGLDEEGVQKGTHLWHTFCWLGSLSHWENGRLWRKIRWLMDSRMM